MSNQNDFGTIARYNRSLSKTIYGDATIVLPPTILVKRKNLLLDTTTNKTVINKTIIAPNEHAPPHPPQVVKEHIAISNIELQNLIQHKTQALAKFLQPQFFILEEGNQHDDYKIIKKIGEGGFSKVYKARQSFKKNLLALKVLNLYENKIFSKADFLKRFKFEFKIGQISDKNILQSYDKGFINGNPYIVSEYADGGGLHKLISDNFSLSIINKIALDVLKGLSVLHQKGIVHRDIKPANIFLVQQTFKIGDFGVSIDLNDKNIENSHTMVGTNGYIAPELLESTAATPISIKNDIFSFACSMFQIISGGVLPFGHLKNKADLDNYYYNTKNGFFRSLRNFRKDIPVYWEDILLKCLQPLPDNRFSNVQEIIEALNIAATKVDNVSSTTIQESKYPYDFFFSFTNENKLLAIEIYSFLMNKGLKIKMSNQLFEEAISHQDSKSIYEDCKHFLMLHSSDTNSIEMDEHLKHFTSNAKENSQKIIIYDALMDPERIQKIDKNYFVVQAKKDILNAIGIGDLFANRHFEAPTEDLREDKRKETKNRILMYVAQNKLKKGIKFFYDYLEELDKEEEALKSLLLISSRYRRYETSKLQGTESFENLNIEENKLILSLNQLVIDYFS